MGGHALECFGDTALLEDGADRARETAAHAQALVRLTDAAWLLRGSILLADLGPGSPSLKTRKGILAVKFINTLYTEGVQDFHVNLRILKHEASYLAAEILYGADRQGDRAALSATIAASAIVPRRCQA
jgi:hypothetical protein